MRLEDYKVVFAAVGLIGVLLLAIPALGLVVHFPGGEKFSELWVLGPGRMAEGYPYNVRENESYLVYLGVGNHMGGSVFYEVCVKLRNSSESLPNATIGEPSSLPVLFVYRVFLGDGGVWEEPLNFSFADIVFGENVSSVRMIKINDAVLNVDKSAVWDNVNSGYFYQLIAELWLYNATGSNFVFHDRFVTLRLNMATGF